MKKKKDELKILYKYRYFDANDYHIKTILNNEFYFASKDELNDPFDLSFRTKFEHPTEKKLLKYARDVITRQDNLTDELKRDKWNETSKSIREKPDRYFQHIYDSFEKVMTRTGVCSFTADIWNNVLMWTHYCNNHTGFCVGVGWDNFANYLANLVQRNINTYKVQYAEKPKSLNLFKGSDRDRIKQIFSNKSSDWNYENEVRLISSKYLKSTISLPNDCIKEVILGLNCSDENTLLIKNLLKQKNENIPLYKILRNEENFKFDRILIDY